VRKTEFFKDATDRDRRAATIRKEKRKGALVLVPTRAESQEWAAFRAAIGDADWRDVVAAWKRGGGVTSKLTVAQAVERYLAEQDERLTEKKIALVTHKKNCPKAKAFGADFASYSVSRVESEEIEEWIDDLGFEAAETFNTYRKVIHAVFECVKKECPHNPASDIELRDDGGDIETISVDDTARLLGYALTHFPAVVPRLALEIFAGLRFSSASRIEKKDINFEDKGILLPRNKIKTGQRHYIDKLPKVLWKWLALANDATWALTGREYLRTKSRCFNEAKVPHPHNCLRHGFCTYHLAAFKNPGLTSTILCHRDQELLWTTYNGRATHKDGVRCMELTPELCRGTLGASVPG
jgi:integrase